MLQALDLAAQATEAHQFKDWWWKQQLGLCYFKLGLLRDAEKQFKVILDRTPRNSSRYAWTGRRETVQGRHGQDAESQFKVGRDRSLRVSSR